MYNLYNRPHVAPYAPSAAPVTQPVFYSAPLAPYPQTINDVINMFAHPMQQPPINMTAHPQMAAHSPPLFPPLVHPFPQPIIQVTQQPAYTIPKFNGTLSQSIPDLLSWWRRLKQIATATARPLLEILDFHVEGETQHFVEQLHRTHTIDEDSITEAFFAHYYHLQ
jgi:hypothetical protein